MSLFKKKWAWIITGAICIAFAQYHLQFIECLLYFIQSVESTGLLGSSLFVVTYVLASILMFPGSILTLGAGAAFGLWKGFLIVSIGSTLGAAFAFIIGRHLARRWIEKKLEKNARFTAIDEAVAREGWRIVFLTRLSPVFPFNLLNYALGLTQIRFLSYVFFSWAGMIPGTVMYVYLGSLGKAGSELPKSTAEWILIGIGLLATIAVTALITRTAKKALRIRGAA